jgi:outer membrane protein OmpA-like peptidoglycan-associated protein
LTFRARRDELARSLQGEKMKSGWFALAAFALPLVAGCATMTASEAPATPAAFDPAACYEREFNVYFERADARLTAPAREAIVSVQDALAGCRIEHVRIVGLARARGAEQINMEASVDRAVTVARFMERRAGWPRERFEMLAAGEAGAVTEEGLNQPMRDRAHVTVSAVAP